MRRSRSGAALAAASWLLCAAPAGAQLASTLPAGSPFLGSVPVDEVTPAPLSLSLADAVRRALDHNLAALLAGEQVARAEGRRRVARADLLPQIWGSVSETRLTRNLEAFGFPVRGLFPSVVGPYNVFEARVFLTQSLLNLEARADAQAAAHALEADRLDYQDARSLVSLVAANAYLATVAADARLTAVEAQETTAEALLAQAGDLHDAGLAAGIDVVRAEVQLSTTSQRRTAARHAAQKLRLQLARIVGLPPGHDFVLTDTAPEAPAPEVSATAAIAQARAMRPDYLAAVARMQEAEARQQATRNAALPSVNVTGDYGAIGLTAGSALPTFSAAATVTVPIFSGGRRAGRLAEVAADVRARQAEVESLQAQIDYEVRSALLDIEAAGEALDVAARGRELADLELTQARDRFAAGVATNVEVVQAQEAVATASEHYIGSVYEQNIAKARLARAVGSSAEAVLTYIGGSTP